MLVDLAAQIVSAYVVKNSVRPTELPDLIASVHKALGDLQKPATPEPAPLTPAVSIRKSITPDYLISLEDGRHYRTLKRHLSGLGLTPDQYRAKWGLPRDYPMVAASYSQRRSEMALALGLGNKSQKQAAVNDAAPEEQPEADAAPAEPAPKAKRGRKPKAAPAAA